MNNLKTAFLLGALMGLFVLVGSRYGAVGMTWGLVLGGLANVIAWFFSDRIALATMRAREVVPASGGMEAELYHMVDELRQRAGLPMPKVCVSPQAAPNAFATGRSPSHAAVCVTEGALRVLSLDELRGVIGHELAHVKNRDTLTSCIAATISGVLAYVAQMSLYFGGGSRRDGHPLVSLLSVVVAAVGAAVIKAAISRSREFVADHDGAIIAGSPDGLMSALARLEAYAQRVPLENPNPAQNSMFIVEPLTANSVFALFASHPPTEARLEALRRLRLEMPAHAA